MNPTNVVSERKKVLKDKHYNPEFHYKQYSPRLNEYRDTLRKLKIPKSVVGKVLHEKRVELLKQIYLTKSIGTKDFTKHSLAIYGKPSRPLIQKAHQMLKLPPEKIMKHP